MLATLRRADEHAPIGELIHLRFEAGAMTLDGSYFDDRFSMESNDNRVAFTNHAHNGREPGLGFVERVSVSHTRSNLST